MRYKLLEHQKLKNGDYILTIKHTPLFIDRIFLQEKESVMKYSGNNKNWKEAFIYTKCEEPLREILSDFHKKLTTCRQHQIDSETPTNKSYKKRYFLETDFCSP